ncbi:MAG: hypothetical protein J6D26_09385 [Clostridia bacterium]|nr:hypothetical protein [Clostridia bacterium]
MIKYIVFAVLFILLIFNFMAQKVMELVLKREVNEQQVVVLKSVLYVIMLLGVVYIMFISK